MSESRPRLGLLDTSVFVALERGRSLREDGLPSGAATSIVSIAELRLGILAAADVNIRDRRLTTFSWVSKMVILPVDDAVARVWAGMRAYLAAAGRSVGVNDMWIAATAAANEIPIITQDRDFHALNGVNGLTVVEV
jgi:predicted nucleic acid-binding protein